MLTLLSLRAKESADFLQLLVPSLNPTTEYHHMQDLLQCVKFGASTLDVLSNTD